VCFKIIFTEKCQVAACILTQKGKYFKTIGILKSGWKNYFVFEGFEEFLKILV
jgi:hypothetical protein